MIQYLVFGILLLKILIISSLTRGYLLTEKEPTGSWYAEIADLQLEIMLYSIPL